MYKVDAEGNLVEVKEGEELTQEEQKMNTTKLSNFGRTVVGVGADLVTESGWRSSASYTRKQTVGSGSESKYSNSFTLRSDLRF